LTIGHGMGACRAGYATLGGVRLGVAAAGWVYTVAAVVAATSRLAAILVS
jgi:hypothetical protein